MFPGPPFLAVPLRALSFRQTASLGVKRSPRIRRGAACCAPTAVLPASSLPRVRIAQRFPQTRRGARLCALPPSYRLLRCLESESHSGFSKHAGAHACAPLPPSYRLLRCLESESRSGFSKHAGARGCAPQPPACRHSSLPRAGTAQRLLQTRRGAACCAPTGIQSASLSAESQNRTGDTAIFSRVLYQLSYLGRRRDCTQAVGGCQASAWRTGSPHLTLVRRRVQLRRRTDRIPVHHRHR